MTTTVPIHESPIRMLERVALESTAMLSGSPVGASSRGGLLQPPSSSSHVGMIGDFSSFSDEVSHLLLVRDESSSMQRLHTVVTSAQGNRVAHALAAATDDDDEVEPHANVPRPLSREELLSPSSVNTWGGGGGLHKSFSAPASVARGARGPSAGRNRSSLSTPRLGERTNTAVSLMKAAQLNAQRMVLESAARRTGSSAAMLRTASPVMPPAGVTGPPPAQPIRAVTAAQFFSTGTTATATTTTAGNVGMPRREAATSTEAASSANGMGREGTEPRTNASWHQKPMARHCLQCGGTVQPLWNAAMMETVDDCSTFTEAERLMATKLQALGRSLRRL